MNCGMKLVGHQAPPTALMVRMSNVPMPFAAAAVGASAASNMPKATQALAAARQMRIRLKTLIVISTPNRTRPAMKSVSSCTTPSRIPKMYLLQRMWVRRTGAASSR